MKKILICIILFANVKTQTLDINALRMAQSQMGLSSSADNTREEVNQSKSNIILDKVIDPDNYIVGPGDLFRMNIISSDDISIYSLAVSPTGDILIPSIGIVNINGLTLQGAIDKQTKKIFELNPTAQVHIQLAEIREFKIKIIGHLQKPGYYTVTPVTRISDIFNELISEKTPKEPDIKSDEELNEEIHESKKPYVEDIIYPELSNRNIKIIRYKDTIDVDLAKFGALGNDIYNPYLMQGDVVFIPFKEKSISIYGGINIPGNYEFVEDENLRELIDLAGGLRKSSDPSKIEITRFNTAKEKNTFSINLNNNESIKIMPEDHIMIRYEQDYKRQDIVFITGEIKYPGVYSIVSGETDVKEILSRSGGYTKSADQTKFFINNKSISEIPDREKERIFLIEENNRSAEEKAYIKARTLTEKGTIESTSKAQLETLMDFKLAKNDEIYIPENFDYIEILGGINKPGRYAYSDEYNYLDYLDLAGGLTKNATRKKFIIKAGTGQRLPLNSTLKIEKGDILFIPDRLEYNAWQVFKDILSTLGSIGALIIVIQNAAGA